MENLSIDLFQHNTADKSVANRSWHHNAAYLLCVCHSHSTLDQVCEKISHNKNFADCQNLLSCW